MDKNSQRFRCFIFLVGAVLAVPAAAQWTVVNLHPPGWSQSLAQSVQGGEQGGWVGAANVHAALWTGSAGSMVDLHPVGPDWSEVWGVGGGQQVGRARFGSMWRASLWSGSAASWVDLNPAGSGESTAVAIEGGQQFGWVHIGGLRAAIWSGTAASWTDLTPAGATTSAILGARAGKQVGWTNSGGGPRAAMWSGTAGSWIDLHPAGALASVARDVDDGQQVGDMVDTFFIGRASLWTGSTGSWVDLSPAGTNNSIAYAVQDGKQVGTAFVVGLGWHAFLWTGSAASAVDLNAFLPANFVGSEARDIWIDRGVTYVAGRGFNGTTNQWEAMLWISEPACAPPDEPIEIYTMDRTADGNKDPILYFLDGNPPTQVTGYNVYRSSVAAPPPSTWPLVASDVPDGDEVTPNLQWEDTSGHVSPTGIWFYEVTAYNGECAAEGPF